VGGGKVLEILTGNDFSISCTLLTFFVSFLTISDTGTHTPPLGSDGDSAMPTKKAASMMHMSTESDLPSFL
jgi:hypothetical protein